jgi:hypothetical protein
MTLGWKSFAICGESHSAPLAKDGIQNLHSRITGGGDDGPDWLDRAGGEGNPTRSNVRQTADALSISIGELAMFFEKFGD